MLSEATYTADEFNNALTTRSTMRDREVVAHSLKAIEREIALRATRNAMAARIEASIPQKMRAWLKPKRYKGAHGGRGSAKSHSAGRILVAKALRRPGLRWLCVREIQLSLQQSVKRLLDDLIKEYGLEQFGFRSSLYEIHTPGGGLFVFQGMQNHTAQSVKSFEGFHGAWVEEAQTLSDLSLKLLRPTIREADSELWFTWNPDTKEDPVDSLLRTHPPADSVVVEINWEDNQHFPKELRADKDEDYARDPEEAQHVWGGYYKTRTKASVFRNISVRDFELEDDLDPLLGADWGFANDPTVLLAMYVSLDRRTLYIRHEKSAVGVEIEDTPKFFDDLISSKPKWARNYPIPSDSARPETISYMRRHGYQLIKAARKGPGSVEEGVKFLQGFRSIVIHKTDCPKTAKEFVGYNYKIHRQTNQILNELVDADNHSIDSARYGLEDFVRGTSGVTW